ncbi:MAG: nucleotidyltransferase domain-containing protein [Bacteroidota bacterium]
MKETQIIKSVAKQFFPECEAILFGSRARNDSKTDSDYDLLIVIDKLLTPEEKLPFRTKIRKELLKYNIISDILIQSKEEVEEKKQLTGHIVKTILKEGVLI